MKAKPWPGRRCATGAIEKIKEEKNGKTVDELFGAFVGILEGRSALPMEKLVEWVRVRTEELIVATPYSERSVLLKPLKTKSVAEVGRRREKMKKRSG